MVNVYRNGRPAPIATVAFLVCLLTGGGVCCFCVAWSGLVERIGRREMFRLDTTATSPLAGRKLYVYACEGCGDSVTLDHPSQDPLCKRCEAALVEMAREAMDEAKAGGTMTLADFRAELEREEA
jgi:uncharacterized paraquat-inducible protein A